MAHMARRRFSAILSGTDWISIWHGGQFIWHGGPSIWHGGQLEAKVVIIWIRQVVHIEVMGADLFDLDDWVFD